MTHKTSRVLSFCFAAVIAAGASSALATDYYWIGGASSEWANGANWSETAGGAAANAYPNSGEDTAVFPGVAEALLTDCAKS